MFKGSIGEHRDSWASDRLKGTLVEDTGLCGLAVDEVEL